MRASSVKLCSSAGKVVRTPPWPLDLLGRARICKSAPFNSQLQAQGHMQNIEPDQVQLEHNASQEPAPHTQEPLQYAPVASSDHDRRFQKVRSASTRWLYGERHENLLCCCAHRGTLYFGMRDVVTSAPACCILSGCWPSCFSCVPSSCHLHTHRHLSCWWKMSIY